MLQDTRVIAERAVACCKTVFPNVSPVILTARLGYAFNQPFFKGFFFFLLPREQHRIKSLAQ